MAINTLYMDNGILKKAKQVYNNQHPKNIKLENFFQKPVFSLLRKKLNESKYSPEFHPYKYRHSVTGSKEIDSFLDGKYFKKLARKILNLRKYRLSYEIRKFESGNYTLLHDADMEEPGIDFIIDFSADVKSFGGYTVYLTEKEELLLLYPSPNTLTFVMRGKGLMKYTKYVQHRQKKPIVQAVGTLI
ncbi:hypothetical protein HYV80_04260 [Candidatus Woesearchaeota archaeon]|nr:hypothetical protein [Candidatus Woesearchaeota archaeon]